MEGPRSPESEEFPEVIAFLNQHLRPQAGWSINEEYPAAFNNQNLHNIRIIKNEGRIQSHAVLNYHVTKTPAGLFKVGAIGSVVTDPQFREQGLSKTVIKDCLLNAQKHGCDFVVLWSDKHEFYEKMGFVLLGTELALIMEENFSIPADSLVPSLKILQTKRVAPEALLRIYSQHTVGAIRTAEDFRRNLQIPNSDLYTAWDKDNQLQAYAVKGKGVDLTNYIHEWGGSVSALLSVLAHIRQSQKGPLTLIASRSAENLSRQLKKHGAFCNQGYLGMFRLLNPLQVTQKIKRYALQLGFSHLTLEWKNGFYLIGSSASGKIFKTENEQDILRLLLGPDRASQMKGLDQETSHLLEKIFPLPFWIWGWDSI